MPDHIHPFLPGPDKLSTIWTRGSVIGRRDLSVQRVVVNVAPGRAGARPYRVAVIARRTAANGALSSKTTLPFTSLTPSLFQRPSRSTVTGVAFICSYRSCKTGTPVVLSPTAIARSRGQSDWMLPSANTARRASSNPFWLWVRSRIWTSANRQKMRPPNKCAPRYEYNPGRDLPELVALAAYPEPYRPRLSQE
jgi:hypothetical protein